jgi:hypothetical protein
MRLQEWWESRNVPRSTAFRLLRVADMEPGKMRVPGVRVPVSYLTNPQVQILDRFAAELQRGRTMPELEGAALAIRSGSETSQDVAPAPFDPDDLERRARVAQAVVAAGLPVSTAECAWLIGAMPGGAEVVRGGIRATHTARNVWRLSRVETSPDSV